MAAPDPAEAKAATAPTVILVRPQADGNVGAVARAMANMGLDRLLLVEPAVALGKPARAMAVKAGYILDAAQRVASLVEALAPFRRVVGTTSGRSRSAAQPVVTARQLARQWSQQPDEGGLWAQTALVFGPEASGLNNDELALCSCLVTIPCALRQPTLNLSQAVLLVAYELYLSGGENHPAAQGARMAETLQVEGLFGQAQEVLRQVGFARDDSFETVLRDLRRLAARSGLSEHEVAILRGICRRSLHALNHRS